ncbi:MAG: SDR family oxidoreductase [Leptolyngbyaceae cyanobacterium T60_A2020_046]|nr:SDR family oxidoreductase [Leptolyngbyaceae cyanobacterium T60_A2020_046]
MAFDTQRRALITGASSGIGRETAIAFAKAGIAVALISRSQDKLDALAVELRALGVEAKGYAIDLAQVDQVQAAIAAVVDDFGPIDILVNNAGMAYTGLLGATPIIDAQTVLAMNVTSPLACIQAVLPTMRDRKTGLIINIASIAAHNAFPEWGIYSASKAALVSLSRVLAAEEREHGIRVTLVSPGAVDTPLWDAETVQVDFPRSQMLTPAIVAQAILTTVQLPDSAVIDEVTLMPSGGAL